MNSFNQQQMMQGANNFITTQRNPQFSVPYFNTTPQGVSTSTNNIVWVQGIEGAKAWQLNPNSMVVLLDSEVEGKMYIKVSDNIGMSSLRIFNYVEETSTNNNVTVNNDLDLSQYVRKDELKTFIEEILNEQTVSTATDADDKSTGSSKPKVITISKK